MSNSQSQRSLESSKNFNKICQETNDILSNLEEKFLNYKQQFNLNDKSVQQNYSEHQFEKHNSLQLQQLQQGYNEFTLDEKKQFVNEIISTDIQTRNFDHTSSFPKFQNQQVVTSLSATKQELPQTSGHKKWQQYSAQELRKRLNQYTGSNNMEIFQQSQNSEIMQKQYYQPSTNELSQIEKLYQEKFNLLEQNLEELKDENKQIQREKDLLIQQVKHMEEKQRIVEDEKEILNQSMQNMVNLSNQMLKIDINKNEQKLMKISANGSQSNTGSLKQTGNQLNTIDVAGLLSNYQKELQKVKETNQRIESEFSFKINQLNSELKEQQKLNSQLLSQMDNYQTRIPIRDISNSIKDSQSNQKQHQLKSKFNDESKWKLYAQHLEGLFKDLQAKYTKKLEENLKLEQQLKSIINKDLKFEEKSEQQFPFAPSPFRVTKKKKYNSQEKHQYDKPLRHCCKLKKQAIQQQKKQSDQSMRSRSFK